VLQGYLTKHLFICVCVTGLFDQAFIYLCFCYRVILSSIYLFVSVLQDYFTKHLFIRVCVTVLFTDQLHICICIAGFHNKNLLVSFSVAGLFHEASHFYTVTEVEASLRGKIAVSVCSGCIKIWERFQRNINYQNFGNRPADKSGLFSWPLRGIYRSLCSVVLKFESFKIKVMDMESVKTEQQLEGKSELKFNQEGERSVNSDSVSCVSVGTQCEQKKDNDSIVVVKCTYSDSEDTVSRCWEDSQVVSVVAFNILCTASGLVLWVQ
jgi:hypothetical protein